MEEECSASLTRYLAIAENHAYNLDTKANVRTQKLRAMIVFQRPVAIGFPARWFVRGTDFAQTGF